MTQQIRDSEDSDRNYPKGSTEKETKKRRKNQGGAISVLWDNIKQINIHMNGVPEEVGRSEKIFKETVDKTFPNFIKMINPQIQAVQQTPKQEEICRKPHQDTSQSNS